MIERAIELLQKLGDAIEQRLVEEMQAPGDFLIDRRFFQTKFAGHPKQRDLVTQFIEESGAFPGSPSRLFQLNQQTVDAAVFFKDGHPLCFGGVRRDDRPDAGRGKKAAQFMGARAPACRLGDQIGECALHRGFAAYPFGLAAQSHRGMLLDDRKQLEPNPMRLENTGEQL